MTDAAKKPSPAMEFVISALKKDPTLDYAAVKDGASKKGFTIFPIMYGRAKALLGMVPVSPRGSKKKAKLDGGVARGPGRPRKVEAQRGPGRPRKDRSALDSLESMIEEMKGVARDRDRYQRALEQISKVLESAL
jgi:hypothetical protein